MARTQKSRKRLLSAFLAAGCLVVSAGVLGLLHRHSQNAQSAAIGTGETTGSLTQAAGQTGKSGLPLPRFVSLKTEKVNVRKGPSSDHDVAWVFQSKGLPVEITAEFETWRRIRDSDGAEGWILQNMLAGKRTALVAPWKKGETVGLMNAEAKTAGVVAELSSGVQAEIRSCDGTWCNVKTNGYTGYIEQNLVWGAYPGEIVN
jgi:SH3-like domain-containing protein